MPGLFVTATDTDVGKTYVAALIAKALKAARLDVGVYKPAASACRREGGILISDDALALWDAAGRPGDLNRVAPQRFEAALAVHLAAKAEGRAVDQALLRQGIDYWRERSDVVIVEGAGGLLSPMGEGPVYVADLAREFGYPLVIVARNALGTINHTLLTLEVARARKLPVAGVVLNEAADRAGDASLASNRQELTARGVPVLAQVAWQGKAFDTAVDWAKLAQG